MFSKDELQELKPVCQSARHYAAYSGILSADKIVIPRLF